MSDNASLRGSAPRRPRSVAAPLVRVAGNGRGRVLGQDVHLMLARAPVSAGKLLALCPPQQVPLAQRALPGLTKRVWADRKALIPAKQRVGMSQPTKPVEGSPRQAADAVGQHPC